MAGKRVLSQEEIAATLPKVLEFGQIHFASQCLYALVRLGVPDVIGDRTLTAPEIAQQLPGSPNVQALKRCLRLLATRGFFEESDKDGDCAFSLAPLGALLQTGAPMPSMACGVLHWLEPANWGCWGQVPPFVAGEQALPPFEAFNGQPCFDFLRDHPASAKPFNEFMTFFSMGELPLLLEHGRWAELAGRTVVDVGGNQGHVMKAVKGKFPEVVCKCMDLPEVIEMAASPPEGVEMVKGDMFDASTIPRADVLFLKHVLHDWNDADSVRILKACHAALGPEGEVHLVESVLPEPGKAGPESIPAINLDVLMMCINGTERTRSEWQKVVGEAGFHIKDVQVTGHPTCNFLILAKA